MTLIIIFLFIFFLGIGLTIPLCRNRENLGISILLAPITGYSIISIIGMYYINFGIEAEIYQLTLIFLAIISFSFAFFWTVKNKLLNSINIKEVIKISIYSILFFILLFLVNYCCNPIKEEILTVRLVPDLPAYIVASQFLLDGGNISNLTWDNYYAYEIFNEAFRWGLPAATSFFAWLNNTSVENVIFYTPFLIYTCGIFASFLILKNTIFEHQEKIDLSVFLPFFMILNVGILYFLFEAFYPQIISITAFTIIMSIFLWLRKNILPDKIKRYFYIIAAIISASIIVTYSEAYVIIILAVGGVLFFDLVLRNNQDIKISILFLLTIIASTIIISPFVSKFIFFTIANAENAGNIGYVLPARMLPSDWTGITNIFSNSDLYLGACGSPCRIALETIFPPLIICSDFFLSLGFSIETRLSRLNISRSNLGIDDINIISLMLSFWVLYEILKFLRSRNKRENAFFLVIFIGIFSFFIVNLIFVEFLGITNNYYLYNKVSTFFFPLIIFIFFSHILRQKNNIKLFSVLFMFYMSSLFFVFDLRKNTSETDLRMVTYLNVNSKLLDEYVYVYNKRGNRKGLEVASLRHIDAMGETLVGALTKDIFFEQWRTFRWHLALEEHHDKELILIVNKDYITKDSMESLVENKILFTVGKHIAVLTGIKLNMISSLPEEKRYSVLEKLFLK